MVRTPSLKPSVDRYQAGIDNIVATWRAQDAQRATLGLPVVRAASAAALTACATQWEFFRSDWHKRAIARDASMFRLELSRRLRVLAEESDGGKDLVVGLRDLALTVDINLPKHPPISTVNRLKDSKDQNVTFRNQQASDVAATRDLIPRYAAAPQSLTREDWLVIEVLICVRNALAHSSARSVDDMNKALARAAAVKRSADIRHLARSTQRVTASGIGRYLTAQIAWDGDHESRVVAICSYMRGLGDKFRV